jgi:hypothetical protein
VNDFEKVETGIYRRAGRWYVRFEKDGKTRKEVTTATTLVEARKERAKRIGWRGAMWTWTGSR